MIRDHARIRRSWRSVVALFAGSGVVVALVVLTALASPSASVTSSALPNVGAAATPTLELDMSSTTTALSAALKAVSGPGARALFSPKAVAAQAAAPPTLVASYAGVRAAEIPPRSLTAYLLAARREQATDPGCHLTWPVLAGIGLLESGHARGAGALRPNWTGTATPPISGPLLDGTDYPAVRDSDRGRLDGNTTWDRAVGPMQFLPSTWARWGVDASADHRADPQNLVDAAAAAADYLCADHRDLSRPADLIAAVFSYNHSVPYVAGVLSAARSYASGPASELTAALRALPTPTAASSATPGPTASPTPGATTRAASTTGPRRRPTPPPLPAPAPAPAATPKATPTTTPTAAPGTNPSPSGSPSGEPTPDVPPVDPSPSPSAQATTSPSPVAPSGSSRM